MTGPGSTSRAERAIALALGLSVVASLGLGVVYAAGGQPQLEGVLIGLSLGGLSVALVLWAHHLLPAGPYVEEREPLEAEPVERAAVARDAARTEEALGRRTFLKRLFLGALAALGAAALFPIRSLGPGPGRTLFHTAWRPGSRVVTAAGTPVRADELVEGAFLTVFPEGRTDDADSQTILVRVSPGRLRPAPGREDWSPAGHVAYSKVCTHAGCPVGLYEPRQGRLFCPCHQSVFLVDQAARVAAGPADRPLPQLPLEVDEDGFLRARDDFPEPVGPSFWNGP